MKAPLRILFIEESDADAQMVTRELVEAGHSVDSERVETGDAMRAALAGGRYDLIVSDWSLAHFGARAALATLEEVRLDIPVIVVSGTTGEETAVEAMRAGARDFLVKARLSRLVTAVRRELRERKTRMSRGGIAPGLPASDPVSEEQMQRGQKLEAIGRLAGAVAHDFSNLLSVILSYTDLAIAELRPDDPLRGDLVEVQKAGQRAAWLTGQLLAFSRRQVLQPQVIDLSEVLVEVEKMLRRLIGEDIELVVNAPERLRKVRVDPGQIEQVLMNLAVNARDAMPRGGALTIQTGHVELDESFADEHTDATPGQHVMLTVTDTGCGMDAATRARMFEPFFTTKDNGTGLGLSTVLGIVQQSGGTLTVQSEPGVGTTFNIYFVPVEDADAEEAVPIAAPQVLDPRGSETILLVEDDDALRRLARGILRRCGYQVLEAQGGGDALLICEQHRAAIDLLLTDVVMPRLSGLELAERIQPLRPGIRVLYMTGYADDAMKDHGLFDARASLLQKPITPETLVRKVREALDATPETPSP